MIVLVSATLAVAGCGGRPEVTLQQLAQSQQDYDGQGVLTRGIVRHERDPDGSNYFVLSDPHGTLVGLEPVQKVSPFEGRLVHVTGVFQVKPGFGRIIHVTSISLVIGDGN
jgi:hypothetical protein